MVTIAHIDQITIVIHHRGAAPGGASGKLIDPAESFGNHVGFSRILLVFAFSSNMLPREVQQAYRAPSLLCRSEVISAEVDPAQIRHYLEQLGMSAFLLCGQQSRCEYCVRMGAEGLGISLHDLASSCLHADQ